MWTWYIDRSIKIGALYSGVDPIKSGRNRNKLTFHITDQNMKHTHISMHQDGGLCGHLCMDTEAWVKFAALLHGATKHNSDLAFEVLSHFDDDYPAGATQYEPGGLQ